MNESLMDILRRGGNILYVRHGDATVGEDLPNLNFQYCCTQRNLSEMGKRQAICYGQMLRNAGIPICYPIQVSPYCRTIESAQLAFGYNGIQVDPFWYNISKLNDRISDAEQQKILDTLRSKLEIIPPRGCNQVIIAHNFPEGIGLGQMTDMGTVIVKPGGQNNGYDILANLSLMEMLNG